MNVAGICRTDIESDMAVETTFAVSEYHGAPTTRLYTPWGYLMNTNTTLSLVFHPFWDFQN